MARSYVMCRSITSGPEVTTIPCLAPFSPFFADSNSKVHFTTHVGREQRLHESARDRLRERHGISYLAIFPGDVITFAPVVAQLAGT
jgi:hypothetical protein